MSEEWEVESEPGGRGETSLGSWSDGAGEATGGPRGGISAYVFRSKTTLWLKEEDELGAEGGSRVMRQEAVVVTLALMAGVRTK